MHGGSNEFEKAMREKVIGEDKICVVPEGEDGLLYALPRYFVHEPLGGERR